MKFYKRDPDRALSGMAELNLKQRGGYNSLIDLLYSRDGDVPDDDLRVSKMLSCHWREWGVIKLELMALGKVWITDGRLCAKRVQETINEAASFGQEQAQRASEGWVKRKNASQINGAAMPLGNASTPTPKYNKKDSSNGWGKNHQNGRAPMTPENMLAIFQQRIADSFPAGGTLIVHAASDPRHPDHNRCLALCQAQAEKLGKGWPHNWI